MSKYCLTIFFALTLASFETCRLEGEPCRCFGRAECLTSCCGQNVRCNYISVTEQRCQSCQQCDWRLNKCDEICAPSQFPSTSPEGPIITTITASTQASATIPPVISTAQTDDDGSSPLLYIIIPLVCLCLCFIAAAIFYIRRYQYPEKETTEDVPEIVKVVSAKELEKQVGLRGYSVASAASEGLDCENKVASKSAPKSQSRQEGEERKNSDYFGTRLGPTPYSRPFAISREVRVKNDSVDKYLTAPGKNRFRPISDASSLDSTGLYRTPTPATERTRHRIPTTSTVDSWGLYRTPTPEKRVPDPNIGRYYHNPKAHQNANLERKRFLHFDARTCPPPPPRKPPPRKLVRRFNMYSNQVVE